MHSDSTTAYTATGEENPLCGAVERLLAPLARLCLANGMKHDTVEELLKQSFIQEAHKLQPDQPQHGVVSRIAAATGIGRREVTRLLKERPGRRSVKIPLASQVIARWSADPAYRANDGSPASLPRQGKQPSFEALARTITRDMHPRSILEELLRLGVVSHDEATEQISLLQTDYIPGSDNAEMLMFLGDNAGDHLASAVANLSEGVIKHHDQAVFADELSEASVKALSPLIIANWERLRDDLVPAITACIEADQKEGRPQDQRLRVGLYSFSEQG